MENDQLPLSRSTFDPWVGRDFTIGVPASGGLLRLHSVMELTPSVREGGGFRLEFTGPADTGSLPQATYRLAHDDLECEIFIVPIARSGDVVRYEALFL